MFQRLQQRMNRKKIVQETEPELSSFYPDTEDGTSALFSIRAVSFLNQTRRFSFLILILNSLPVESIVITPFLPVVAFGRPLPKLSQQ